MDRRASLGGQRPRPPQRAVSGGSYSLTRPPPSKPPTQPSKLSNPRSISQPGNFVDIVSDQTVGGKVNVAAFAANGETVVRSPEIINIEDDDEERPAKRLKASGPSFRAGEDSEEANEHDKAHYVSLGSPLPVLPKIQPVVNRSAAQRGGPFGIESTSRKSHGLDPPAAAARVPAPKKAADFSPWTGSHPEDVLNENVVKTGFFDKVQGTNQAESNSARATISSSLSQKNSHGLSLLSYLFTTVLEKRHVMGKCTTSSSFKPPPRVTVTDTKREAWLRDLANPDVPLRKQSRTIPHGIRGKLLMEQCLSKNVPLQRAVWLAKCVGANELRAFRRKGVSGSAAASGESKWVQEWTVHVEQFLEEVIGTCGQENWRQKMNYAIKLASAFYSETLLDIEQYLDWIVTSLNEARLERLPIWIVLVQIYWKDIVKYGRRGRRLAEGILEHLYRITKSDTGANYALKARLQSLITALAVFNRGCLIIPRTWENYKHLMTLADADTAIQTTAYNIAKRNKRLSDPMLKTAANTRSPLLDLYDKLDSIGLDANFENLIREILQLLPDVARLCSALLDWASTPYRTGISRVYHSARIIAHLHNTEYDTDSAILKYLGEAQVWSESAVDQVHGVIVELIRLNAFSASRYLQWLIASGVLSTGKGQTCATKLITALSISDLPTRLHNTRMTLMRRLGYPVEENSIINKALQSIHDAIVGSAADHVDFIEITNGLSLSARFHISHQTCRIAGDMAKDSGIGLEAFNVARGIIEFVEDLSSLASLIKLSVTTDNSALLATVVDTVSLHAESLTGLGEFDSLIDALTEQYLHLRSQQPLDRNLILELTSLTKRVRRKEAFVKLLNNDLALCEQQNSVAVCSPASDSVIGMHASYLDTDDDIDAVFASGNTMDEQLMQRVFARIMQRAQKPSHPSHGTSSRICGWLNQLRSVEASGVFEDLVTNHVQSILDGTSHGPSSMTSIVYLATSGCISLPAVVHMAKSIEAPQVAANVLPLFLSPQVGALGLHRIERYRFCLQQSRCREEHAEDLSKLVHSACKADNFSAADDDLLSFITWCITARPQMVDIIFADMKQSELLQVLTERVFNTFPPNDRTPQENVVHDLNVQSIVRWATPLSVRHCGRALTYLRSAPSVNEQDDSAYAAAVQESFAAGSDTWPQLLEFAGEHVNRQVHEWVQGQILLAMSGKEIPYDIAAGNHMQRYLDVLAVTSKSVKLADDTATVTTITDKLKDVETRLSELDVFQSESSGLLENILSQLRIALDLCAMHVHSLPDDSEATKQGRGGLLAALCALLTHSKLQSHPDVMEYLFDLASTLSDTLPEGSQILLQQRNSSKAPTDARLTTILGTNPNALDSWLVLASQALPSGSQQQRALNKHAGLQQQTSGRPTAPGQHQQTLQSQHQRVSSIGAFRQESRVVPEIKTAPFPLHPWEIMPEVMGENNTSLDLKLFAARKV